MKTLRTYESATCKRVPFANRAKLRALGVMLLLALGGFVLAGMNSALADDWPQFRGANSDGITKAQFPLSWSQTENVRWKIEVPGEGWSSPVIWNDQVILTTAVPIALEDSAEKFLPEQYEGGGGRQRSDLEQQTYEWKVMSLDLQTGKLNWQTTVKTAKPSLPRHSSNTYATETPITDGERIYAYFGMTGLFCLDMQGELLWKKDLGSYEMRAGWGTSSSPVLFDGKLFVQVDNDEQSFAVALDSKTGEEIWRVSRDEKSQYSSPIIWQNSLRNELILGGMFYRSYDPDTGKLLWELDMEKGRSSATPVAIGDRLFVGNEFRDRGGADDGGGFLFAIQPGGSGSIALSGEDASDSVSWKTRDSGIQMASPAYCQGYLYFLERRRGVVVCIDAETGEQAYQKRLPQSRVFWASPWATKERIFCLDDSGTTHVLAAGKEFEVLGRNTLEEQAWSTPSIADGALLIRTAQHLYCISEPGQAAAGSE